ncbi:MAG: tetratricopeptide repeat protein [Treponema sp.]|nr:tetratricopeptide repeat protein [Treponema sp.]
MDLPGEPPEGAGEEADPPLPVLDLAETSYPDPAPPENITGPVSAPEPRNVPVPPPAAAPAPVPAAPPPVSSPPPAPPAPAAVPQRETPPPAPPALVRPSLPGPPPDPPRESFSPPVPDMPFRPVTILPAEPEEKDVTYSRTVRAFVGQFIEIPFRGRGWVYLGEFGSRRGVRYDSRRNDEDGMVFVFHAGEEGTYSLKFNRQDFSRDYILNDYVQVVVETPPQATGSAWSNPQAPPERVSAGPRWPPPGDLSPGGQGDFETGGFSPVPELSGAANPGLPVSSPPAPSAGEGPARDQAITGTASGETPLSAAAAAAAAPSAAPPAKTEAAQSGPAAPEEWLQRARTEYEGGRIAGALSALEEFMSRYPAGSDEAYWLYGQALEAGNEATRDIRLALDYYRRLLREYPQSRRYDEARRRAAYLERFYFNIQ